MKKNKKEIKIVGFKKGVMTWVMKDGDWVFDYGFVLKWKSWYAIKNDV